MKLKEEIRGVGPTVASVILHLYDKKEYPIFSKQPVRAIEINAVEIDIETVNFNEAFWRRYVNSCRAEADRYDVSMRTLDRALWGYSESGNANRHR